MELVCLICMYAALYVHVAFTEVLTDDANGAILVDGIKHQVIYLAAVWPSEVSETMYDDHLQALRGPLSGGYFPHQKE